MSLTPGTTPMRAGARGFREPLRVPRVDGVCRPIHPHLAGHLFHDQRPPGRFFFGWRLRQGQELRAPRLGCSGTHPQEEHMLQGGLLWLIGIPIPIILLL